jgi:hypothetical protein
MRRGGGGGWRKGERSITDDDCGRFKKRPDSSRLRRIEAERDAAVGDEGGRRPDEGDNIGREPAVGDGVAQSSPVMESLSAADLLRSRPAEDRCP